MSELTWTEEALRDLNKAEHDRWKESERLRKEIEADRLKFLSDTSGWDHGPAIERKKYSFPWTCICWQDDNGTRFTWTPA